MLTCLDFASKTKYFPPLKYNENILGSGKQWCSTKTDAQGAHVKGNWGYCDDSKCRETSKDVKDCRTTFEIEAPSRGLPCVFPFKYDKKTFYECTDHKDSQSKTIHDIGLHFCLLNIFSMIFADRLWCSTKTSRNGQHLKGNWGYCDCQGTFKDLERFEGLLN